MKLLVVEDELGLRRQLCDELGQLHYQVEQAEDGEQGLYLGTEYPIDLAIVDLGLPKMSGVELIKAWRHKGLSFPILILTARGSWQDKVEGLDAGADDYLVKPFQMEELVARVKALIRRACGQASSMLVFGEANAGQISLDLNAREVRVQNQLIDLTAYEYNTLEYLVLNRTQTISKTELTEHLYTQDFERDSNVIEVFVGRLRKKLDPDGSSQVIKTVRGQGYRFMLEPVTGS